MSQKTLVVSVVLMLSISFATLGYIAKNAKDPNLNKNWWVLSFQNPSDESLDFTIENHSNNANFVYEISRQETTLKKENLSVPKGETKNINVEQMRDDSNRTTVTVWTNDTDKKEIYK